MTTHSVCDAAAWIYLLLSVVTGYGAILFFWWWFHKGAASVMYILVSVLFVTLCVQNTIEFFIRYQLYHDPNYYSILIQSNTWKYRKLPQLVAASIMVMEITRRVYTTVRGKA
jgi:hypothetical protein